MISLNFNLQTWMAIAEIRSLKWIFECFCIGQSNIHNFKLFLYKYSNK